MRGERALLLSLLAEIGLTATRLRAEAARRPPPPPFRGGRPVRAALFSAYPQGHYGTGFRLSRWVPHLAARGVEAEVLCSTTDREFEGFIEGGVEATYQYHRSCLRNTARNVLRAAEFDVVLVHRGLLPYSPWQRPTLEGILRQLNPRFIYDIYDSLWFVRQRAFAGARGRAARWLNPADLVETLMRGARAVTVSNEHLATFARPLNPDVRMLPMVLDPSEYEVREHRSAEVPVFGWMGGGGNLSRLEKIAPALRRAAAEVPFRLRVISSRSIDIPGVEVECLTHPWSPEAEVRDLVGLDAGLLPMFDDGEDRGKSPLKLLQYSAAGLPTVASPVAVDRSKFKPGEAILFADTEKDWAEAIVRLAGDARLRAGVGARARAVLEAHYTFEAHADAFAAVLTEVASRA